jgi:hypothetical protein
MKTLKYATSCYRSNKSPNVNTFRVRMLCNRTRFSVLCSFCVYWYYFDVEV